MTTVNITTFAFNLSTMTRKTLEASTPFHTCYTEADSAGRKQLRAEWMLGHVMGSLNVDAKAAERLLSKGKGEGAKPEHVKAIDRASSDFRHHVIRPDAKVSADKTAQDIEVPADIAALAAKLAKLCNEYEGARKLASVAIAQAFSA